MQRELFIDKSDVLKWQKTFRPSKKNTNETKFGNINFVDLFSGCGGLSSGINAAAESLGYNALSKLAVDSNKTALDVYARNIPHRSGSIFNGNIEELFGVDILRPPVQKKLSLAESLGKIDVLVAGPPCQGHSDLNNSTRRNDPRNKLYMVCIKAVEILNPDFVVIENVPSVVHSSERVTQNAFKRLRSLGYFVKDLNVNFLDLGVPQARKRHVLIASKSEQFINSIIVLSERKQIATLGESLSAIEYKEGSLVNASGKLSETNVSRVKYLFDNNLYDLPNEFRPACHRDKKHSYNSVYGRLSNHLPAQTLTSGYGSMGQGRYIHPTEQRTINSAEAARIQGFPDSFDFSSSLKLTELRKMIANAVPPQLMYILTQMFISDRDKQVKN